MGHRIMGTKITSKDVQIFFESDPRTVSSPLTIFGSFTSYGHGLLRRNASALIERRVLDAGAGFGLVGAEIKDKYGATVVSIEFCRYVHDIPPSLNPVQGDILNLPFADNSFDTVICLEVLEHTLDMEFAISEISRVLKNDGVLLLSVPNYLNIAGLVKLVVEKLNIYEPDTFAPFDEWKPKVMERFTTCISVLRILKRQGFVLKHVEGVEIFDAIFPFANRIPRLFSNVTFLKTRMLIDRFSSFPLLKWISLHTVFRVIKESNYETL